MQTVIVKEENLDIHQSCSHNCDTWYIEDSMNYTECDGYYHCRYIDSSYEICEPVSSLIKNQTHWSPRTCSESRYSDEMEYELDLPIKSPQNSIDKYRGNVLFHYSGLTKDAG
ncbi:GSCOCG00010349001-RA-CDS, partial [Cotesia congregata]